MSHGGAAELHDELWKADAMDVQRYGPTHRDGDSLEALYSVAGILLRFRAPVAAFAAAWPRDAGLADPTELCTEERLDALAIASFGYLVRARLLVQNLAHGLHDMPLLRARPDAPWFAEVAARIGGRG